MAVGDPGNAADSTGYGAVASHFAIGKYEVTIGEYTVFLNAVAASDPYGLYSVLMSSELNVAGISRSGSPGSFSYAVSGPSGAALPGAETPQGRPIAYVSWFDAARFANWMHNGATVGADTENGAYTLNGDTNGSMAPARNPDAKWWIPTENEWYKAAYYKGGGTNAGYWLYPTRSDAVPGNLIGGATNQSNYRLDNGVYSVIQGSNLFASQNHLTDVGAFSNSASPYGTFDQGGNLWE